MRGARICYADGTRADIGAFPFNYQGGTPVAMDFSLIASAVVSTLGFGKRTEMEEYRITNRGGKGIITMRVAEKTGPVVGVLMVTDEDQIMLITTAGKVIRLRVSEARRSGRNTQGVHLIGLEPGEQVVAIARLAEREEGESESGEEPEGDPV